MVSLDMWNVKKSVRDDRGLYIAIGMELDNWFW